MQNTRTHRGQLADAMRIVAEDLDLAIDSVRGAQKRGKPCGGRARTYLRLLKMAMEYRAEAAEAGYVGPLWDIIEPKPFNTGFVGISAEEAKARAWKVNR